MQKELEALHRRQDTLDNRAEKRKWRSIQGTIRKSGDIDEDDIDG